MKTEEQKSAFILRVEEMVKEIETLMQEAYLRLPEDIDESESLMLAAAVAEHVFLAAQREDDLDCFLQEHALPPDADCELLLNRHECSFG